MNFPLFRDAPFFPDPTAYTGAVPGTLAALPPVLRATPGSIVAVKAQAAKTGAPWVFEASTTTIDKPPQSFFDAAGNLLPAWTALSAAQQSDVLQAYFQQQSVSLLAALKQAGHVPVLTSLPAWIWGRLDQPNLMANLASATKFMQSLGIDAYFDAIAVQDYGAMDATQQIAGDMAIQAARMWGKPIDLYFSIDVFAQGGTPMAATLVRRQLEMHAARVQSGTIRNLYLFCGWNDSTGRVPYLPSRDDAAFQQLTATCNLPWVGAASAGPPATVSGSAGN